MRTIKSIIIHCADTPEGKAFHAKDIDRWHRKDHGWKMIGYHYVITLDGIIEPGRPESMAGAHCMGDKHHQNQNPCSIGICYIGGRGANGEHKDTRTEAQRQALRLLVDDLRRRYPSAQVYGHCDFDSRKTCPNFDVHAEF